MKKNVKIIIAAAIILSAVVYFTVAALLPIKVSTEIVRSGSLTYSYQETGTIKPLSSWKLSARSSGRVSEILVTEGQQVSKGQVIARLETPELDLQIMKVKAERSAAAAGQKTAWSSSLSQKAALEQQLVSLKDALESRYHISEDGSIYDYAARNADREFTIAHEKYEEAKLAYDNGLITNDQLVVARALMNQARDAASIAEGINPEERYKYYKSMIESTEALLKFYDTEAAYGLLSRQYADAAAAADQALRQLEEIKAQSTVESPIDGAVVSLPVTLGDMVAPGMTLCQVYGLQGYELEVFLLAENAAKVKEGDVVSLNTESGFEAAGRVRVISPAAIERVSSLGLVERRVRVVVEISDLPEGYGAGYSLNAVFTPVAAEDTLSVPSEAIVPKDGGYGVYIASEGKAKLVQVETGSKISSRTEITAGLTEGDEVIINPMDLGVKQGSRVKG